MDLLTDIMNIAIYSALGIILMVLGNFLIDLLSLVISLLK